MDFWNCRIGCFTTKLKYSNDNCFTSFTLLYVGGSKFKHIAATLGFGTSWRWVNDAFSHSRQRIIGFWESINGGVKQIFK